MTVRGLRRDETHMISIDVVVPTYRRPNELSRCLAALAEQTSAPQRVLVVARVTDEESRQVVDTARSRLPQVDLVDVHAPGVIAAMSAGVAASESDIVAFTDDDAAPHPDWVERLLCHFSDPAIGVAGGRDVIAGQTAPRTEDVGVFRRFGKLNGNHHLGTGPAREVDVLKGANIAFRMEALALPRAGVLRGRGAQVDWEVMCCTHARRQGWRVVYDPAVLVDHYPAPRHDADQRGQPLREAVFDAAHNSIMACVPLWRLWLRRAAFGVLVGTADRPGLGRAVAGVARVEKEVCRRVVPSLAGQLIASIRIASSSSCRREPVVTAQSLREGHSKPARDLPLAPPVRSQGQPR